jgi:hypothetical protein
MQAKIQKRKKRNDLGGHYIYKGFEKNPALQKNGDHQELVPEKFRTRIRK